MGISAAALRRLVAYQWPGNVRELANVIERAVALTDHDTLVPEDLDFPSEGTLQTLLAERGDGDLSLQEVEQAYVRHVLETRGGNKAAAARTLRINRRTLYRMIGRPSPRP